MVPKTVPELILPQIKIFPTAMIRWSNLSHSDALQNEILATEMEEKERERERERERGGGGGGEKGRKRHRDNELCFILLNKKQDA